MAAILVAIQYGREVKKVGKGKVTTINPIAYWRNEGKFWVDLHYPCNVDSSAPETTWRGVLETFPLTKEDMEKLLNQYGVIILNAHKNVAGSAMWYTL